MNKFFSKFLANAGRMTFIFIGALSISLLLTWLTGLATTTFGLLAGLVSMVVFTIIGLAGLITIVDMATSE